MISHLAISEEASDLLYNIETKINNEYGEDDYTLRLMMVNAILIAELITRVSDNEETVKKNAAGTVTESKGSEKED